MAKGDPANGIFPHLKVSINQKIIGECNPKKEINKFTFFFDTDTFIKGQISITMDNDQIINNEDRNAFVENIYIFKNQD